jgi:hypothetical protein
LGSRRPYIGLSSDFFDAVAMHHEPARRIDGDAIYRNVVHAANLARR